MQENQPISHIIQLGESVQQVFHPKYLDEDGQLTKPLRDFVKKLHKDLKWLENNNFLETENLSVKNLLTPWREERIIVLRNEIRGLEDGTFIFLYADNKCHCQSRC